MTTTTTETEIEPAAQFGVAIGQIEQVQTLHRSAIKTARKALDYAAEAGGILEQMKETCKHGQWLPLLKHIGISDSAHRK